MAKKITILGSTGSIGKNTLNVVDSLKDRFSVYALSANNNIRSLMKQASKYNPEVIAVRNEEKAEELKCRLKNKRIKVLSGLSGLTKIVSDKKTDIAVIASSGSETLFPVLEAIKNNKKIALANKESIVMAGAVIKKELLKHKAVLIPVDSEHNAIFQCLLNSRIEDIRRIILPASGGPFFDLPLNEFKHVTVKQAINHPRWDMGEKISVDSATLMNKALEIVEACCLFGVSSEKIEVVIHPESIIHSMVEFKDGNIAALMAPADMRMAIQYALTFPERLNSDVLKIDFSKIPVLNFKKPDLKKFPALKFGFKAAKQKGTMPAVMNAANETAVEYFLNNQLKFNRITEIVGKTMQQHNNILSVNLDSIMKADKWARNTVKKIIRGDHYGNI